MVLFVVRKIPTLLVLPEEEAGPSFKQNFLNFAQRFKLKPRPNFYKAREIKEKSASLDSLEKKDQIDLDGDYWQRIQDS